MATLLAFLLALPTTSIRAAQVGEPIPIGQIQGSDDGAMTRETVTFRGVVTGLHEDRNAAGIVYYTFFVQDIPGSEDGDPQTSDAVPVFSGTTRPDVAIGDVVLVTGRVTEFFNLTEIDDAGMTYSVEASNQPLPQPVVIDPPADNDGAAAYYEPLEGMLVAMPGQAVVVGPTFSGCGLAVVSENVSELPIVRHRIEDPIGQVVPIMYHTDVSCDGFPDVKTGDRITGLVGPLTYNFDLFRIVWQPTNELEIMSVPLPDPEVAPTPGPDQITIASFNVENYFDTIDHTGDDAEPKLSAGELAIKQEKLAYTLIETLNCATVVAIQEVENEALLIALAEMVAPDCGFPYQVNHLESADARGIDVALLTHPALVTVLDMGLRQSCTLFDTGITDQTIDCPGLQSPLFSRPPLQVDTEIGGQTITFLVNHFKSKSGGEEATGLRRAAQAQHIHDVVTALLEATPERGIVVLGDFNDYDQSPSSLRIAELLVDAMQRVPEAQRYSYVFSGAAQLIDSIYLSPVLDEQVAEATILHVNADFPDAYILDTSPERIAFKSSDHDIPLVVLNMESTQESGAVEDIPGESVPDEPVSQPNDDSGGLGIGIWVVAALGAVLLVGFGAILLIRRQSAY